MLKFTILLVFTQIFGIWDFWGFWNFKSNKSTQSFPGHLKLKKKVTWKKYLTKFQLIQRTHRKNRNKSCLYKLNELKFCEVSWNPKSNGWLKFHFSMLKKQKSFIPKKIWSKPYGQSSYFLDPLMAQFWSEDFGPWVVRHFILFQCLKLDLRL